MICVAQVALGAEIEVLGCGVAERREVHLGLGLRRHRAAQQRHAEQAHQHPA
ncbi:MAG: hypothetical protein V9G29_17975 [Burkholderiaceae bacterium]